MVDARQLWLATAINAHLGGGNTPEEIAAQMLKSSDGAALAQFLDSTASAVLCASVLVRNVISETDLMNNLDMPVSFKRVMTQTPSIV